MISPSPSRTKTISTSFSFKNRGSAKTGPDGSRCYTPIEDWEQRPRVLTYLRKSPQLQGAQVQGSWGSNRDILVLQVQAWNCHIQIINVYNAPPGSLDPGQGVQSIISHVTSLL